VAQKGSGAMRGRCRELEALAGGARAEGGVADYGEILRRCSPIYFIRSRGREKVAWVG